MSSLRVALCVLSLLVVWCCGSGVQAQPFGWRTDGSGRYPDAAAPTTWSASENVRWATALPSWSNATPVVVGERIFVCAEPTTLLCVSALDGSILWQHANSYEDALTPEQVAAGRAAEAQLVPLREQRQQMIAQRKELEKQFNEQGKPQEIRVKLRELGKQFGDLEARIRELDVQALPATHSTNGYSSPTVVSDGRHVFALFGNGVAACYDLAGQRQWIRLVEKPTHGWGHSSSPVLVDGLLILPIIDLHALDPATGETRWRRAGKAKWGSPVVAVIEEQAILLTPFGEAVRPRDGQTLAAGLGDLEYNAPIFAAGVAYYIDQKSRAIRLTFNAQGTLDQEVLWQANLPKDRYYASPVLHDGIVYAINQRYDCTALDARDGTPIWQQKLDLGRGTAYPSITLAGPHLYVSSDNGATAVLTPGRAFAQVARNQLEAFRACPVLVGNRLYLRGMSKLYCIQSAKLAALP